MRLKTFTAPNMPAAMKMVREAMGENAIIVASEPIGGKRSISVTAAIDSNEDDEPLAGPAPRPDDGPDINKLRFDVHNILRFHNMPELFVAKLMQKASDEELSATLALHRVGGNRDARYLHRLILEKVLRGFFSFEPLTLDSPKTRLMLVGAPGVGKTLTIAKMAARMAMDDIPLSVVTTDNKRAGGIEQLHAFTSILGIELVTVTDRNELATHLKQLPARTRVLIDTAGCNPYDRNDLREVSEYASINSIEPVLVMQSGGDSLEAIDAVETLSDLPIKRLMVTRTDTTRRFGSMLAVAAAHGLAFSNISSSPSIVDTPTPADGALLAQILLRYQLQS